MSKPALRPRKAKAQAQSKRDCVKCGMRMYRSNYVRSWIGHNPGHRDNWKKVEGGTCVRCTDPFTAARAARIMRITFPTRAVR